MNILELFCGTKSISKAFQKKGFEITTLDIDPQFDPDICKDILQIQPEDLEGYDIIWASPPCTYFSIANCNVSKHWGSIESHKYFPRSDEAKNSIQIIKRTLKIIKDKAPKLWFIENPRGMLRHIRYMIGLPRSTITYCQYGAPYMKPTDIWGYFPPGFPVRKCKNGDKCHIPSPRGTYKGISDNLTPIERSIIPEGFCSLLAGHCKDFLKSSNTEKEEENVKMG